MDTVSEPPVPLRARRENGGTPEMTKWYLRSETGPLRDVLLARHEQYMLERSERDKDMARRWMALAKVMVADAR